LYCVFNTFRSVHDVRQTAHSATRGLIQFQIRDTGKFNKKLLAIHVIKNVLIMSYNNTLIILVLWVRLYVNTLLSRKGVTSAQLLRLLKLCNVH